MDKIEQKSQKKKKNKIRFKRAKTIFLVLFFLCGFCLALYPFASDIYLDYKQKNAVSSYSDQVDDLTEKEKEDIIKNAQEYENSGKYGGEAYYNALNFGESMCILEIDSINVKLPVYHGTSKTVLDFALGHLETSSLPVGGSGTHCVITGHTGLTRVRIFDKLNDVKIGDQFKILLLDRVLVYEVDEINVVLPQDTEKLQRVPGKDYVTLVTCTPYGINTHRLLVRGTRVGVEELDDTETDNPSATKSNNTENAQSNSIILPDAPANNSLIMDTNYIAIAVILLFGLFIVILILLPSKKKNKKDKKESKNEKEQM